MNPKISIITITFNSEKTLEDTIKSVTSQNYDNLEYLIIDGGSSDNTLHIVEKYRNQISFFISEPDQGISDAFNKGIKNATGEIIGIINSDDLLLPGSLNIVANAYDRNVDIYRGNTIVWNERTDEKRRAFPSMKFPVHSIRKRSICHQSTFVSKRAYDKWGCFDLTLKFMMDADLLIRLYEGGAKMKYIDHDLAVSRSGGVTDKYSFWVKRNESYNIIKNNGGGSIFAFLYMTCFLMRQSVKYVLCAVRLK